MGKKAVDSIIGGLAAEAERDAAAEREYQLKTALDRQRTATASAEAQRKAAVAKAEQAQAALECALSVTETRYAESTIKQRERASGVQEATAVLLYSDIHPDEVVEAATVNGLNEFNPDIARARNKQLAIGVKWMLEAMRAHHGRAGFKIRDFILGLLGDLISNTIHPELAEGNSMMPAEAILFATELCCEVIDELLKDPELERIVIPCCHGNHDRMTVKIRHQTKAGNSLAWILYHNLAARYANESRVEFSIARGNMVYTEVYGHTLRWTHGDDIRYWGGSGGIGVPARKAIDAWNESRRADITSMGHFHTITDQRDFVINGSMIGYSAFAQAIKARFEPASQAFFLIDKKRGKRMFSPIFVQDGRW